MLMMDFIILKVNGIDLSAASHEQVLEVFNSASEPIFVEVARRYSISHSPVKATIPYMMDLSVNMPPSTGEYIHPYATTVLQSPLHSYPSPKRLSPFNNQGLSSVVSPQKSNPTDSSKNKDLFSCGDFLKIDGIVEEEDDAEIDDEEEQVEIIKEEVVLRKKQPREIFGLTLSYSALSASDNSESEVYISAIEPNSVARKEPNIHLGDQILQINNVDVHSKAQVVSLFQKCGLEVRLLLGRPNIIPKNNGYTNRNGTYNSELSPLEEVEYASVYDEVENKDKRFIQLDKDSGIGRGTDEAAKTEDSSECDSNQTSLRKSGLYQPIDTSCMRTDPAHIAQLMQHLALEYQQLQKLLHGSSDSPTPRVQPLPPPTLFQASSRIVPRMGTKLDPPTTKSVNGPTPASGSNTSAYSTGADSSRSSPLTMELGPNVNSTSLLSLKIDPYTNYSKCTTEDNYNMSYCRLKLNLSSASKSSSSSSTNNPPDSRMTCSTILQQYGLGSPGVPLHQSTDSECHYYDVYDPLTKSSTEAPHKSLSRSSSQADQSDGSREHEYINAQLIKCDKVDSKMEWVVKKRPDGTRYITRRPVRNKFLKEREKKLNEERSYTTEEEDANADLLVNRYWTKADKRKHYDKIKDKKHKRKSASLSQQSTEAASSSSVCPASCKTDCHAQNRPGLRDVANRNINSRNCDIAAFFVGSTMF